ncbi:hypothetical protein GHK45_32035 [Sinorhizobium meliloti]|uniref:Serine protease n=1 Tax=Rhizobium meliloti TaxID=382 RepID=A0A6A7ZZ85_RHIML|nr:serine protease [Sinorhizobium meliloti]MQW08196.1 hypothetical protein [Sinorhizobium meliloti]
MNKTHLSVMFCTAVMFFVPLCIRAQAQVISNTSPIVLVRMMNINSEEDRTKGSGFILNKDGFIITARHVVADYDPTKERLLVSMRSVGASPVMADIIMCSNGVADICLIKVDPAAVEAASINSFFKLGCWALELGADIRAVGFPFGQPLVQNGGRITGLLTGSLTFPTDAQVVPGMSGGPVFLEDDVAVGIVRGGAPGTGNLTFVTPFSSAKDLFSAASSDCPSRQTANGPAPEPKPEPEPEPQPQPESVVPGPRLKFNNDRSVTLDDLPKEAFQVKTSVRSAGDIDRVFRQQPSLEFIGSSFRIESAGPVDEDLTLYLSSLKMTSSTMFIGNSNLKIVVNDLDIHASSIRAFPVDFISAPGGRGALESGARGEDGADGLSGGLLEIYVLGKKNGDLRVNFDGQNGGPGGQGGPGREGAPGEPGQSGSDSPFDCKRGPGDGGRGLRGTPGGEGGSGGMGGNGGNLRIYMLGSADITRKNVAFVSRGGLGGSGGSGGDGGPGGPGGPRGFQTNYCRGGSDGPRGESGASGKPGPAGDRGLDGTMSLESVQLHEIPLSGLALP